MLNLSKITNKHHGYGGGGVDGDCRGGGDGGGDGRGDGDGHGECVDE